MEGGLKVGRTFLPKDVSAPGRCRVQVGQRRESACGGVVSAAAETLGQTWGLGLTIHSILKMHAFLSGRLHTRELTHAALYHLMYLSTYTADTVAVLYKIGLKIKSLYKIILPNDALHAKCLR